MESEAVGRSILC